MAGVSGEGRGPLNLTVLYQLEHDATWTSSLGGGGRGGGGAMGGGGGGALTLSGSLLHRENRENNPPKIHVNENTGNLEILPNSVCSSCRFPISKGKEFCNVCRENLEFFFLKESLYCLPSQFSGCNSHKSRKFIQGKFAL